MLDIIVVNHNSGSHLLSCLRSIVIQPFSQIILLDNDSNDESLLSVEKEFAQILGKKKLIIVRNKFNIGFAAACNQGLQLCHAPFVLFINPDCVLEDGVVEKLLAVIHSNPTVGMVSGCLYYPDGRIQQNSQLSFPRLKREWLSIFLRALFPTWFKPVLVGAHQYVDWLSGACILVRSTAIQEVGLWDEAYFLYYEDLDWCMRFKKHGYDLVLLPDVRIVHVKGVCGSKYPFWLAVHKWRGMRRFFQTYYRLKYGFIFRTLAESAMFFRLCWQCVRIALF